MSAETSGETHRFDIVGGLKFFFQDPNWIGHLALLTVFVLLSCALVGLPLLMGYGFRVTRRHAHGEPPLPPLSDLGGLFVDGLRSLGFHAIHLVVFLFVPGLIAIAAAIAGRSVDVLDLERLSETANRSPFAVILVFTTYALGGLLMLLAAIYMPAARIRFTVTDRFAAGFEVGRNLAFIRRNAGNYILIYLEGLIANLVSNVGYLACCVGIIPAAAWAAMVMAWAEGEVARCDQLFLPSSSGFIES
jgi:hypothetical protein